MPLASHTHRRARRNCPQEFWRCEFQSTSFRETILETIHKAYSKSFLVSPTKIDRRAITRTALLRRSRLKMPRADSSHMRADMFNGGLKRRIYTAFKFFKFQTAGFGLLDMPVKPAGNFSQSQRVARRESIDRKLQPSPLFQMTRRNRRASRFVIDHAQRAIRCNVESINITVQTNLAGRCLQHQRRLAHPKTRLHFPRSVSLRNFIQFL